MLLLSPVRKNNVVASLVEDAPFRVTLSLSSRTVNRPELASRNPKTVTAVPGDSSASRTIRAIENRNRDKRTSKIEVDEVPRVGCGMIRSVEGGQRRVILEYPLTREWEGGIVGNGIRESHAGPEMVSVRNARGARGSRSSGNLLGRRGIDGDKRVVDRDQCR
jgi:hypothetical protein